MTHVLIVIKEVELNGDNDFYILPQGQVNVWSKMSNLKTDFKHALLIQFHPRIIMVYLVFAYNVYKYQKFDI